jgi:DNA-binding MarR family transcriptional regulator
MASFQERSPDQLRAHREQVLLRLLIRATQAETNEVIGRVQELGFADVRPSYVSVLGVVDTEGTRLVTLARRTGTTRQAVSQLVAEIEAKGYLERGPDPDDGRAVLVRHTTRGRELLATALEVMTDVERRYVEIIGEARMRQLKRTLTLLVDAVDEQSRLEHR